MWCTLPPCAHTIMVRPPCTDIPCAHTPMVHIHPHGAHTPMVYTHTMYPHTLWYTPPMCTPSHGAHTLMMHMHTYPMGTHLLWYISSMVHTHPMYPQTPWYTQPMCTPPCGVHTPWCTNSPTIHMPFMVHIQRAGLICCENEGCFPAQYERGSWAGRRNWVSLLSHGRSVFFQSRTPGEAGQGLGSPEWSFHELGFHVPAGRMCCVCRYICLYELYMCV